MSAAITQYATTDSAPTTEATLYVHIETRAERYAHESNYAADRAIDWGIQGDEGMSSLYAHQADMWAGLAAACRFLELALERLP